MFDLIDPENVPPTTEVVIFDTSEAFRENTGLITPVFDIGLELGGSGAHPPVYYGKQIKNPGMGHMFLDWDSYEAHKSIMDKPAYPDLVEALKLCLDGKSPLEMYHVEFSGPTIALQKPLTEVSVLTLKAPVNRWAAVETMVEMSKDSEGLAVFGHTREDEDKYILLRGWESVEAYQEAIADPYAAEALEKLYSVTNKEHVFLANMLQHAPEL